jgi:nicotinamidase-related amidase
MSSPPSPRKRPQRHGIVERTVGHSHALVILDMISCWGFPDAAPLLRQASRIAPAIAALKRRCAEARIPVIYANDNSGQWRSDFRAVVRDALGAPGPGARITQQLEPGEADYFVLKPKHSAFFATPFELLLDHLRTQCLVVTGVASDQCVLNTVSDARMRDFEVVVPADCIATQTPARNRRALQYFEDVLGVKTTSGPALSLTAGRSGRGR